MLLKKSSYEYWWDVVPEADPETYALPVFECLWLCHFFWGGGGGGDTII